MLPIKCIEYKTFYKLWKQLTPYIKFQTPETDLCDTCETFARDMIYKWWWWKRKS